MIFEDYAIRFSKDCIKCYGKRYISEQDKMVVCPCQLKALIMYRYEEIPISSHLKKLDWQDYTGNVPEKKSVVTDWKRSRDIAFGYCFSDVPAEKLQFSSYDRIEIDYYLQHRISKSRICDRLREGANLFIMGDDFSGKTFLSALVAKEIIYASVLHRDIYFKWVSFHSLINALTFDKIDYGFFDEISYTNDFLVLDNIYIPKQRNFMQNMLDELFYERFNKKKPIIVTGPILYDDCFVREKLGNEIFRIYNHHKTNKLKLHLEKEKNER